MTFLALCLFGTAFILAINVVTPYKHRKPLTDGQIVFVKMFNLVAVGVYLAAGKVLWSL